MFLGLPDPHPDPLVTSTDPDPDPSHESVVRIEIMVAKSNFSAKFFCNKFYFSHQTYFHNFELFKISLLKHKKYEKNVFLY
jgi:hypothetical protein